MASTWAMTSRDNKCKAANGPGRNTWLFFCTHTVARQMSSRTWSCVAGNFCQTHKHFMQILHSISKERLELVNSMSGYMSTEVMPILKDVDKLWQPADFLPESSSETFIDEVQLTFVALCCSLYCNCTWLLTWDSEVFKDSLVYVHMSRQRDKMYSQTAEQLDRISLSCIALKSSQYSESSQHQSSKEASHVFIAK